MQLFVTDSSICFSGRVGELLEYLAQYPPETTLQELIKINIH